MVWLNGPSTPAFKLRPSYQELERQLHEYAVTRSPQLRDQLVAGHEGLVRYVVGRFKPSGCITYEDLMQVGQIGLIASIERFDPAARVPFVTFAVPTIIGTLKHYLRDHAWALKAPRRVRELGLVVRRHRAELEQRLGRVPTPAELAAASGITEEMLLQAMDVDYCFQVLSLDAHDAESDAPRLASLEAIGELDPEMGRREMLHAIRQAMNGLDERLRNIIHRRFFLNLTQSEVAESMGISQMHVSRLERKALRLLRDALH